MIKRRPTKKARLARQDHPQTELRFEQLFHKLPTACFCCDTSGVIVEWNRGSETLFGQSCGEVLLKPVWKVVGRPEDAEIVCALFRSVIDGQVYESVEMMDRASDGTARGLLCSAFPLHSPSGTIIGAVCTCVDISERLRMEQELWQNEERWQLALRGNNDGIWDWNLRSCQLFVSQRWQQIYAGSEGVGSKQKEVALVLPVIEQAVTTDFLRNWFARVHPDDQPGVIERLQLHLAKKSPFYISEHRVCCGLNGWKWVLDRGQALWDCSERVVRVAGSITDITERKRLEQEMQDANAQMEEANEKLAALATSDGLTGLKNHRAFQERLTLEMEQSRRHGQPLSLILLDVDHFKQYNDAYGHPAGDAVLREVARQIEAGVRCVDLAARYGGEEFVLLLPHCASADAVTVAERCRKAIAEAAWPKRGVTASFGIATFTPSMSAPADLVAAADKALYAAKHAGRNRFAVASVPLQEETSC